MSMNWKEDFLYNETGEQNIPQLTVWETDVEEVRVNSVEPERYSIRFISDSNDLSPDVFDYARNAIDVKLRNERMLSMALETKPIGSTKVGSESVQRIVGIRALFDANPLPFMTNKLADTVQPGERVFPADYFADSEKWAKLAETGTYRPASQISTRPDLHDATFKQGAFAELFKDAARRALIGLCNENKDRKLSDYSVKFFGGEQGIHSDGSVTRLEVSWCQSNADPVEATCTLRVPMLEVQDVMTELFIAAHNDVNNVPQHTTIDEMTVHMHRSATLPKKIVQAAAAVEEIVRAWAVSPSPGVHESISPIQHFDKLSGM